MNAYSTYHPIILLIYFLSVIFINMLTLNPIVLVISALAAMCYFAVLSVRRVWVSNLAYYMTFFVLITIANPIFSHNGETVLFFLNDRQVTLEAVLYGAAIGGMIVGVIYWCKCFSAVMTSDKTVYLFGRVIPKLSVVLSITLRFIPLLKKKASEISAAQSTLGMYSSNSIVDRVCASMRVFSAVLTWSLENAVDTANSMQARGYGLKGRTSFSIFTFTRRDAIMLAVTAAELAVIIIAAVCGKTAYTYYPTVSGADSSVFAVINYIVIGILMFTPSVIEFRENIKWKFLISKI